MGHAFKLTVTAAVTVVAGSSEPSVVSRAHRPSRVRHLLAVHPRRVAAPSQRRTLERLGALKLGRL